MFKTIAKYASTISNLLPEFNAAKVARPTFNDIVTSKKVDDWELECFYLGQAEEIVKKDIKKKVSYTQNLGLKETANGALIMNKQQPDRYKFKDIEMFLRLDNGWGIDGAVGLQRLIDICDKKITPTKKDLHDLEHFRYLFECSKDLQCADNFFPDIWVESEAEMRNSNGIFYGNGNEIHIRDYIFRSPILGLWTFLHEFAHKKQYERGSQSGRLLPFRKLGLPRKYAIEMDADLEALNNYPDKKHLVAALKLHSLSSDWEFPYLPIGCRLNLLNTKYKVASVGPLEKISTFLVKIFLDPSVKNFEAKLKAEQTKYKGSKLEKEEQEIIDQANNIFELKKKLGLLPGTKE